LRVLGVGVKENSEQASSWSQQHGLTHPVITDPEGKIYRKFGTGSVPYHVLIDKKFIIRHSEEKFERDHLSQLLNEWLPLT
jgi:peroxiredoxin